MIILFKSTVSSHMVYAFLLIIVFLSVLLMCCTDNKSGQEAEQTEQRLELIQPAKWWEKLPRPVYATLERVETSQQWFEVYKLIEGTYAIYEPYQFEEAISYLVIGNEKGVVIDTGTGIGDLNQVVSELTELPVSVLLTHTHWDHIGNNYQFEEITVYHNDYAINNLYAGVDNAKLLPSISGESICKPLPQHIDPASWTIPSVEPTALLEDGDVVLTHCNAGSLATVQYGTALAPVRAAIEEGKKISVIADETRPRLQGARLTAYECQYDKIPVNVIADNSSGLMMMLGKVKKVIVGTDRVSSDAVFNKIGTYLVALAAKDNNIPFYVAAPLSTLDLTMNNGEEIPIEERADEEVTHLGDKRIAPIDVKVFNPAFDITPGRLVTAIITENGIATQPYSDNLKRLKSCI